MTKPEISSAAREMLKKLTKPQRATLVQEAQGTPAAGAIYQVPSIFGRRLHEAGIYADAEPRYTLTETGAEVVRYLLATTEGR